MDNPEMKNGSDPSTKKTSQEIHTIKIALFEKSPVDLLRVTGVLAILGAGVVFLVQGLFEVSSLELFFSFGGLTLVLALLGLFMGLKMQASKSARAFLLLTAATTPVLFSQLGGMLYSGLGFSQSSNTMAQYLSIYTKTELPIVTILAMAIGTAIILSPILYLGFGAIFRKQAKKLVRLLLLGSFFLLVPFRGSEASAVLIAGFAIVTCFSLQKLEKEKILDHQADSRFVSLLPLIPLAIMAGRALFYPTSPLLAAAIALAAGLFFKTMGPLLRVKPLNQVRFENLSLASFAASWLGLSAAFLSWTLLPHAVIILIQYYPLAIMGLYFGINPRRNPELKGNSFLEAVHSIAVGSAFLLPLICLISGWDLNAGIVSLGLGSLALIFGLISKHEMIARSGITTNLFGFLFFVFYARELFTAAPWISLAALGILAIFTAGWLEKNRSKSKDWIAKWQAFFKNGNQ